MDRQADRDTYIDNGSGANHRATHTLRVSGGGLKYLFVTAASHKRVITKVMAMQKEYDLITKGY
jgi:hypothetical protein